MAGDRQATLNWSSAANASGYLIDQSQAGAGTTRLAWPVTGTSFTPGLLAGDSLYQFRVVPVNDNGQIHLVWNATPGANAYAIRSRDLTTGSGWTELPLPVQATTYDLAGVPDHVYDFEIQPGKGVMTGVWSPEASQLIRRVGTPSGWSSQVLVKAYLGRRKVATDFAKQWAYEPNIGAYNTRYGSVSDDDCTHFVSEALLAAGLPQTGVPSITDSLIEQYQAVNDNGAWWRLDPNKPVVAGILTGGLLTRNASGTFTLAPKLRDNLALRTSYGQAHEVSDPRLLDYGDVIFFKWAGESGFSHTVIVTGFATNGMPLISEHTTESVNTPLTDILSAYAGVTTSYWHLDVLN